MAAVTLGFIGYGIMGERLLRAALGHDPAIIRVAGVWDPATSALRRLEESLPAVPRLASAEAIIAAAECVYVASPPSSHLAYAGHALAAGRALLCEKPLAVDVQAARRFVADAAGEGLRAAVNFPFASSFAVDQLKAWLHEGAIGTPERACIEVAFAHWPRPWQTAAASWLARRAEGGFTREVISHFLFLVRRLLGPLELRTAHADYPEGGGSETAVRAELSAGELPLTLAGRVGGTELADHNLCVLEGPGGALRLRDWSYAERLEAGGVWRQAPDALPNEQARPLILRRQLDQVARMTRGEPHDLATLAEALEVQTIVEAILASRET
jgi:predicted dehydrogenase